MEYNFSPYASTPIATERNIRIFFALLVFWSLGGIFPLIFWPQSYAAIKQLEHRKFPQDQMYKFHQHMHSSQVYEYIRKFAQFHKHKATVYSLHPKTYENRTIIMVRLRMPKYDNKVVKKGNILVVAGVGGCIWDSVAAAIDLIHKLCEECSYKVPFLLEFNWYIIPIYNPDGYDYTLNRRDKKLDADTASMKNRHKFEECYGVLIDRNFGFHWGESKPDDYILQCAAGYAGPYPFSEEETKAMKNFIDGLNKQQTPITMYIQLHGSKDYDDITYPWRFTKVEPFNRPILESMVHTAADTVNNITGSNFLYAQSGRVDHASGLFSDYLMGVQQVLYCFTIEPAFQVLNSTDVPDQQLYIEKVSTILFSLARQFLSKKYYTSAACLNQLNILLYLLNLFYYFFCKLL